MACFRSFPLLFQSLIPIIVVFDFLPPNQTDCNIACHYIWRRQAFWRAWYGSFSPYSPHPQSCTYTSTYITIFRALYIILLPLTLLCGCKYLMSLTRGKLIMVRNSWCASFPWLSLLLQEWNVFDNILGNYTYISVLVLTMILQVILVAFWVLKTNDFPRFCWLNLEGMPSRRHLWILNNGCGVLALVHVVYQ